MSEEPKNALTLSGFLSEDRVLILTGKQEKDDVLNALIETLAEVPEIDGRDDVARGIFHRESLLSTGIGNGLGVP
ncbi:MAG: PTS sugar transporter subunit IIA, partial [Lentisphaeria bacterium]|nr:PTS sugar transporter subunit IIA [Lentisphaeria bacterium]